MVYTPWPAISNDDPWSSDDHDKYFKDNFAAMPPAIFTSKGDMAVATGADACDRLPAGTNGQIVEAASGEALKVKNSWGYVPIGGIILWSGDVGDLPANWKLCDGNNGTPDLRNQFVIGAGGSYGVGDNGGAATRNLQHTHTLTTGSTGGNHKHTQAVTGAGGAHSHEVQTGVESSTELLDIYAYEGNNVKEDGHYHTFDTATESSHTHTNPDTGYTNQSHTHSVTLNNQLSSSQNMMPTYYALAYIMRIS